MLKHKHNYRMEYSYFTNKKGETCVREAWVFFNNGKYYINKQDCDETTYTPVLIKYDEIKDGYFIDDERVYLSVNTIVESVPYITSLTRTKGDVHSKINEKVH